MNARMQLEEAAVELVPTSTEPVGGEEDPLEGGVPQDNGTEESNASEADSE